MEGRGRPPFEDRQQQAEALREQLRQAPGAAAQHEMAPTPSGPAPSRWSLRAVRATVAELADYSLSGVWRILQRADLCLRSARARQYSPDPEYLAKRTYLEACLAEIGREPLEETASVLLFLDEVGFCRWPAPAPDWSERAPGPKPIAERAGENNQQWRLIGALNARTGAVDYLDGYIVGREKVIAHYQQLVARYPAARRIYVVQDNWSIHRHVDVLAALTQWPQIEPVWLPTYAPWLNPIEKLWRWLRQDLLKMHRQPDDWKATRAQVRSFLDQFRAGSQALLQYVGLLGDGRLACALRGG